MENTGLHDVNFSLRYDGLDAEKHEIELSSLGESLKGYSKILATAGTFALNQKYSRSTSTQEVKFTLPKLGPIVFLLILS